jgi:PEGA domain
MRTPRFHREPEQGVASLAAVHRWYAPLRMVVVNVPTRVFFAPTSIHPLATRTPRLGGFALALLFASALSNSALAQRVVLLPIPESEREDEAARTAQRAATDALGMQGLQVVSWEAAIAKLSDSERAHCQDIAACAPSVMQTSSAELTAGVVVVRNGQRVSEHVRVALLDSENHRFEGAAEVKQGDVRGATTRALLEARSFQLIGPGPWLQVEGTPDGAEVLLDDRVLGRVPYRAAIAAGRHQLRVRDHGYTAFEQALDVPSNPAHRETILVALEPLPLHAQGPDEAVRPVELAPSAEAERDENWIVWPIAIGTIGLGLAGVTTVRLATGVEDCVMPDEQDRCTETRSVNWTPTVIAYSLSAALIGTSVVWLVLGMNEAEPALSARFGLDGVTVAGSF